MKTDDIAKGGQGYYVQAAHEVFHTWNLVSIDPSGYTELNYGTQQQLPSDPHPPGLPGCAPSPFSLNHLSAEIPTSKELEKFHYFRAAKTNIMRLQKALIYLIIFVIFLLGVYEIRSGNVGDFAYYKNSTEPIYVTIPGDWLIIGAIGLFLVISHTFYKIRS
jgi:hypothetical protein